MAVDSPRSCNSRLRAPRLLPLVVALLCAQQAMAQDATPPASEGATNLDKVVVTGSNIRTTTAAEEGPAPVAIISSEDIALLGFKDVKDILQFDVAFTGWSDTEGYDVRSTVNMRGLGDQYTLVLLNGRRFSAEQAADMSLIPIGAVDRVEILKDGASALYGSDAVGGVVNIITRKNYDGVEIEAFHGNTTDTDTSNNQLRLTFGGGTERLRLLGSLGYNKRNGLYSQDRDISSTQDMRRFGGYDVRSSATNPAVVNVPGLGEVRLDTSRFGVGQYSNNPDDYVAYDPETDNWSRPYRSLVMPLERINFFGQAEWVPFGDDFTLFADVLYSNAKSKSQGGSSVISFSDPAIGAVPGSNPYNPFAVDITDMSYRAFEPNVGLLSSRVTFDTTATRLMGGFRGWLGEWSYEAAVTYFREDNRETNYTAFSKSGLASALARSGADAFNPFCYGCNTAAQMAGIVVPADYDRQYTMKSFDARASGPVMDNWAGTINAAFGTEYRDESYRVTPDALYMAGDIVGYDADSLSFQKGERQVKALFAEVSVPLLGANDYTRGAPALELNLAARAERYSDFGSTNNPKASLRWQLPLALPVILRASWGTSFKAPSLSYLRAGGDELYTTTLRDPAMNTEVEALVVTGTNPFLQPEEARYTNFGVVVSPLDNEVDRLTFGVDYYRVRQSSIILSPNPVDVLTGVVPGQIDRTPGAAQDLYGFDADIIVYARPVNGASRDTDGIDFNINWERKTEQWGNFTTALSASRLIRRDGDNGDGRPALSLAGFATYLHWRANLMVDWNKDAWRAGWVYRYIGGYDDGDGPLFLGARRGSYSLNNVSLAYDTSKSGNSWLRESAWTRKTTFKLGVDNVFDKGPEFLLWQNDYVTNLSDLLGRSYYISLKREL